MENPRINPPTPLLPTPTSSVGSSGTSIEHHLCQYLLALTVYQRVYTVYRLCAYRNGGMSYNRLPFGIFHVKDEPPYAEDPHGARYASHVVQSSHPYLRAHGSA